MTVVAQYAGGYERQTKLPPTSAVAAAQDKDDWLNSLITTGQELRVSVDRSAWPKVGGICWFPARSPLRPRVFGKWLAEIENALFSWVPEMSLRRDESPGRQDHFTLSTVFRGGGGENLP